MMRAPKRHGRRAHDRGSATIQWIIIIGLFAFAIVAGVRSLSTQTNTTLECQGQRLLTGNGNVVCRGG
ncbi:MAG TPA: hypothetical protein VGG33_00805, partial [Polyangia bacterium]